LPEGPELRISKDILQNEVIGKRIHNIHIYGTGRYASNKVALGEYENFLSYIEDKSPLEITDVSVKGKFMYWTFSDNNKEIYYMFSTFGMTGQWSPVQGKHPCLSFKFTDGTSIFFNDPRHFGTIKFTNNKNSLLDKLNELGWDPFTPFKDKKDFIIAALKKSNKSICEDLMNQKIFAGVGNYIRAEALYLNKTSPWTKSFTLNENQIISLCDSIQKIMEESYNHQGATISTYKDAYGAEGKYTSYFKVYGKKMDPNGYKVIKEESPDGRTIHWCPQIQLLN
jgi:formamidopyrimidine-DNA glycosylase